MRGTNQRQTNNTLWKNADELCGTMNADDGRSQIKLRANDQTVWLTQLEMAELFDATKQNISHHLKNVFEDGELTREATTEESSVVQIEGNREVQRSVNLYNLDAILAMDYRVHSLR